MRKQIPIFPESICNVPMHISLSYLKNKMDIKSVFLKYKREVENELEKKIKISRSVNGKEFCNRDFSGVHCALVTDRTGKFIL